MVQAASGHPQQVPGSSWTAEMHGEIGEIFFTLCELSVFFPSHCLFFIFDYSWKLNVELELQAI